MWLYNGEDTCIVPHEGLYLPQKQCATTCTKILQYGRGTSAGGQIVNGELMRGGHRRYGGPNFDRLCNELKVLLLLSCNYMMHLIGYDSIKTH